MVDTMRIAICDDSAEDLKEEHYLITEAFASINRDCAIEEFNNPEVLVQTTLDYDLIFLDIEMDGTNGLEVARKIREKNSRCLLFFVTNYENYMDSALDEFAFRFWVKPMDKIRLKKGIASAIKRIEDYHKCIEINVDRVKTIIDISKIIYICAENKKTRIVTTDSEYLINETLKVVKEMINSYFFYMPHASFYVNLNYVEAYNRTSVICGSGTKKYEIYMSRRKYVDFNKYFIKWMGEQI